MAVLLLCHSVKVDCGLRRDVKVTYPASRLALVVPALLPFIPSVLASAVSRQPDLSLSSNCPFPECSPRPLSVNELGPLSLIQEGMFWKIRRDP